MITHQPQITVDFRGEDFSTLQELRELTGEMLEDMREEYPFARVAEIIISSFQLKLLRFERYQKGVPIHQIKSQCLEHVEGIRIVVTEFDEGCVECGGDVD